MSPYLYASMNIHGINNFRIQEIDTTESQDHLDDIEELWIAKLGTTDRRFGYNVSWGGASRLGPDTRAKLSTSLKGKPAWNKGQPMSEEHLKNTRLAAEKRRGVPLPITPQGRENIRNSKLGENNPNFGGKSTTPESIEKRAVQLRGKPSWNKGVPQTEEAREKMRGPRPSLAGPRPHRRGSNSSNYLEEVSTDSIKQLRSIGFAFSKIAERVGCSAGTVKNRLNGWPESEAA